MEVAYSLIQHVLEALSNIAIYRDIAQYRVYHDFYFSHTSANIGRNGLKFGVQIHLTGLFTLSNAPNNLDKI